MAMNSSDLGTLIKLCSLSREQVAARLDVTTHTINNWCTHRTPISPHHLEELAHVLWESGISQPEISGFVLRELEYQGLLPETILGGREELPSAEKPGSPGRGLVPVLIWSSSQGSPSRDYGTEVQRALQETGFQPYVIDCAENHRFKRSNLNHVQNLDVAGVVLAVPGEEPNGDQELEDVARSLAERQKPVVFVQYYPRSTARLPSTAGCVAFDSAWGVHRSVELLTMHGHRRIGAVFRTPNRQPSASARASFEDAVRANATLDSDDPVLMLDNESETQDIARLVSSCTAVHVGSSESLLWLAQGLHRLGLSWPDDISVMAVAYNKTVLQLGPRPFTYLDVPIREIARDGARMLRRLIEGESIPATDRVQTHRSVELVLVNKEGGSVGPPRTSTIQSLSL